MYDKQAMIDYIKEEAYKTYIDKASVQERFNYSVRTSERVIRSIHYKHMQQHCIDMMKDIEGGVPSSELVVVRFSKTLYKRFPTDNCCYTLKASGKSNVTHLLDLLYADSNLHLDRKYNKYLEITKM